MVACTLLPLAVLKLMKEIEEADKQAKLHAPYYRLRYWNTRPSVSWLPSTSVACTLLPLAVLKPIKFFISTEILDSCMHPITACGIETDDRRVVLQSTKRVACTLLPLAVLKLVEHPTDTYIFCDVACTLLPLAVLKRCAQQFQLTFCPLHAPYYRLRYWNADACHPPSPKSCCMHPITACGIETPINT